MVIPTGCVLVLMPYVHMIFIVIRYAHIAPLEIESGVRLITLIFFSTVVKEKRLLLLFCSLDPKMYFNTAKYQTFSVLADADAT